MKTIRKKSSIGRFLIGMVFVLALIGFVSADVFIEAFYETGDDNEFDIQAAQWHAQTFNVSTNQTIEKVQLKLFTGSGGDVFATVAIRTTDSDGVPTGGNLTVNDTFNFGSIVGSSPGDWINITLPNIVLNTSDFNYSIIVGIHDSPSLLNWREDRTSPTYLGGHEFQSVDAGNTWTTGGGGILVGRDHLFEIISSLIIDQVSGLDVILNSPKDTVSISADKIQFNATGTPRIVDDMNLQNATFFIYNGTQSIFNISTNFTISGTSANNSIITLPNFVIGDYIWNTYICGTNVSVPTNTSCAFASANNTFSIGASVGTQFVRNSTYDTDNSTFIVNITLFPGTDLFSANLIYNGSPHQGTIRNMGSNMFQLERKIDIPVIEKNTSKNFHWAFTFESALGTFTQQNSSSQKQFISSSDLNDTVGPILSINYTIFDEVSLQPIDASFDGTFSWFLGDGTVKKNSSFAKQPNHEFDFYLTPNNRTFFTDVVLDIASNQTNKSTADYVPRIFDFAFERFTNITTLQQILLLNKTLATNVQIEVLDQGLNPLENIFVTIKRFYPGENKFRMVENKRTDIGGTFNAKLVDRDVRYNIEFRDSQRRLLKKVENIVFICPGTGICTREFIIEDLSVNFDRFGNVTDIGTRLSFNNNTNNFRFSWNDIDNENPNYRLQVDRISFNGTANICNDNLSASIGILNCAVGDSIASYRAQGFVKVGDKEKRVALLNLKVGSAVGIFGLEGLMWGFILLFTLIAIGAFHPIVGFLLYFMGLIILGFTNIIYLDPAIIIAQLVIGGLFIWAFRG